MPQHAIKQIGNNRVGGYLVVWGDASTKDLQGEYFTKNTDLGLDWYQKRPMLYHHGLDGNIQTAVVGVIDTLKTDEVGLWAEGQLNMRTEYDRAVQRLVDNGALSWSSGSLPHLVVIEKDGEIKRWPIVEGSLTPSPAEPRHTNVRTIKSAFDALGLDTERLGITDENLEEPLRAVKADLGGEGNVGTVENTPAASTADASASQERDVSEDQPDQQQPPADEPDQPGDDTPEPETEEGIDMDQLDTIIQATAQMLGFEDLTDEQLAELRQQIAAGLEQQTGETMATMSTNNIRAAFRSADFRRRVKDIISGVAQPDAPNIDDDTQNEIVDLMRNDVQTEPAPQLQPQAAGQPAMQPVAQPATLPAQTATPTQGQGGKSRIGSGNGTGRIGSMKTKYERAGLSVQDLAYLVHTRSVITNGKYCPSSSLWRELTSRAEHAVKTGKVVLDVDDDTRERHLLTIKSQAAAVKTNEVMSSGQADYGGDWIADLWSTELYRYDREENVVVGQFQQIDMPSDPYNLPIEGVDPQMYYVPETTNAAQLTDTGDNTTTLTKGGTDKVQLTSGKLQIRIAISGELEEDSIIPVISEQRRKALQVVDDTTDSVILNADPSTVGNINLDGGTPDADSPYMFDAGEGLILNAMTLGTVVQAGGPPTLAAMRKMRGQLDRNIRHKLRQMVYFVDSETHMALLNIPEFMTLDKMGPQATILTGQVGAIDGIPVLTTAELKPAAANGKVSSTAGNNTRGRALLVYRPYFKYGYRRTRNVTSDYNPYYDAHMLIVSVRVAQKAIFAPQNIAFVSLLRDIAV